MARKKRTTDWQDVNQQIFQKLDVRAEYESMGLEFGNHDAGESGWLECYPNKSAAINVNSGRYRDLGGNGENLSLWDYCVHVKRFSRWTDARNYFAAKVDVKIDASIRDPAEHLAFQNWVPSLATLWCNKKTGVTPESLLANGARMARYREQYSVICLPIFGPGFSETAPIGYVLYNITGADLPIFHGRDKTTGKSAKPTWAKMKTTGGSEGGLIGQYALDRLTAADANPAKQLIWKVEGPTDLLALWAIIPPEKRENHLVITNSGGAQQTPLGWIAAVFVGRMVAVVGDADEPGQAGAAKWAAWAAKVAGEVRRVSAEQLGYEVAKDHGRDLRDWITEEAA
jgi:hypothetical protein